MNPKLFRAILISLLQCDGIAMPEAALISSAQILSRPAEPTDGDILNALKELEGRRLVEGVTDGLMLTRSWTLTTDGTHAARKLR